MTLLGNRDTRDNVVLTGVDAALLDRFRLADGTTYEQVVAMASAALSGFNGGLANDPFWSMLVSYTDRPDTRYAVGNSADRKVDAIDSRNVRTSSIRFRSSTFPGKVTLSISRKSRSA